MQYMTSYAGNFEDVLLMRLFGDVENGLFIDVGTSHARGGNCSWAFYQKGWRGVNVEPGPLFATLEELRPEDTNLNIAVSDHEGEATFFYHEDSPATSTMLPDLAPELEGLVKTRQETSIKTTTLNKVFEQHVKGRLVQFLKVDVEGHEGSVFAGLDLETYRPQVIVAEATRPFTNTQIHDEWSSKIVDAGYRLTLFDGVNVWLVREEDPELAALATLPVNQLDFFRPYDDEKDSAILELEALSAENRKLLRRLETGAEEPPIEQKPSSGLLRSLFGRSR